MSDPGASTAEGEPADRARYLEPTWYLDADSPEVSAFAREETRGASDHRERAVALFRAVRDGIRYDPYDADLRPEAFRASAVLARGHAFCVPKAILLAAATRAVGVPSRLGFVDVRNHLTTERLRERMGTDLFVFHGFTELRLGGRWVQATPTFDASLCERFGVRPLEFDGREDALFHPYDRAGRRHMEYVRHRGHRADFPREELLAAWAEHYPRFLSGGERTGGGDFAAEARNDRDGEASGRSA